MPKAVTKKQREKAVLIAKDALKWIKKPTVKVKTSNAYCAIYNYDGEEREYESSGKYVGMQLQDIATKLFTKKKPCEVCGLGVLFLGKVGLYNKFKVPDHFGVERAEIVGQLDGIFSNEQMNIIETCFESVNREIICVRNPESISPYYLYFKNPFCDINDDNERLKDILKAIIKGDGELILEKAEAAA